MKKFEVQVIERSLGQKEYRITHIKTDSRIATCFLKENADYICKVLNNSKQLLPFEINETQHS
jgi:hypothetical protein